MIQLGVNIDHVATVRQARYRGSDVAQAGQDAADIGEPDPVRAAHEAELGGADGITVHLREDRRHITDRDVRLLRRLAKVKLNLEMAATEEMVAIATELRPHTAMLVPEGREEVTTEGGLDVAGQADRMADVVARLHDAGLIVSAFIDAERGQVDACAKAGFDVCEVHTGPWAGVFAACGGDPRRPELAAELTRVSAAGAAIRAVGMRFNAGHALNYHNVEPIAAMPGVEELHIGHAIVSRAVYVGLRQAVHEMKQLMTRARLAAGVFETERTA
ncbi:MAG: pyridoxine 5'-phosphate synthase [Phycisphaeraceae bacterium]|nr:MAG: pyridoxine 5'-phosphate synthase [Phycisphaeraceae bacterium]